MRRLVGVLAVALAIAAVPSFVSAQEGKTMSATGTVSAVAPDTPTMAETGFPGIEMSTWYGISAPAGTPRDIVGKLNAAIVQTLNTPKMREKLESTAGPRSRRGVRANSCFW